VILQHVWFELDYNGTYQAESLINNTPFISNAINVDNKGQNSVLLVARCGKFTVYANNTLVGAWYTGKLTKGGFYFAGYQDAGTSVSTFKDTWIWGFE
jgi:hypothetical protein